MALFLTIVGGICWTWVYIEAIRLGYKEKTYAIPLFVLALNFSWEILHSIFGFFEFGFRTQNLINVIWAIFDVFIVITFFKFGYKYFADSINEKQFLFWSILVFVVSFPIQYAFIIEFGAPTGAIYSAFIQNLIMSVLFIDMFYRRNGSEGQSLTIAINKWIGTLAQTANFVFFQGIIFVAIFGAIIAIFDIIYIILLYQEKRKFS